MIPIRTIGRMDGSASARDELMLFGRFTVAHAAGGAGVTVSTALLSAAFGKELPSSYNVVVQPSQDVSWWITAKTAAGFTLNQAPRLAANSISASNVEVLIFA